MLPKHCMFDAEILSRLDSSATLISHGGQYDRLLLQLVLRSLPVHDQGMCHQRQEDMWFDACSGIVARLYFPSDPHFTRFLVLPLHESRGKSIY